MTKCITFTVSKFESFIHVLVQTCREDDFYDTITFDTTIPFDQAFISLFQVTQALGTASVPKDSTAQQVQVEMSRPVPPGLTVTSWD